jgi:trehalose 6-phosphate synthase
MEFGSSKRLIVISNRLPVTISKDASGEYHFKMSSGGLVSALSGTKKHMQFTWIGWPGFYIPVRDRAVVDRRLMEEHSCMAVYLDDELADSHYNGFSNSILWPLFHYHPGEMNFDEQNWLAYRQANLYFAQAVRKLLRSGDMVWVQDYHLMLLPMFVRGLIPGADQYSRREVAKTLDGIPHVDDAESAIVEESYKQEEEEVSDVKIGFFLHTPFPSSEIYRCVFVLVLVIVAVVILLIFLNWQ